MFEEIVNYFQRVLIGKTEKRDHLISLILCGSIFVISWWLGGPVGGFSFVLAVATIWNVKVTRGLLSRSEETFEQSRISFLVDIVDRTIEHAEKFSQQNQKAQQVKYIKNKARAIKRISIERAIEFLQAMVEWGEGKFEDLQEELKELEKKKEDQ